MLNGAPITKDGDPILHERRARKIVTNKMQVYGLPPDAEHAAALEMLKDPPR